MPKLGIIIVNYEKKGYTKACLLSLEKHANSLQPKVILIDNSEKNKLHSEFVNAFNLNLQFISNVQNNGFAGAINLGLEALKNSNCDFFFLLNNDVLLVDDSIQKMQRFLTNHNEVSVVGGINYSDENKQTIWQAGLNNNWTWGGVKHVIPKNDFELVDYVPGSTFMGRLESETHFEERYFMYVEENDYCQQALRNGGVVAILKNTAFIHKNDGNKQKSSPFIFYYMCRNELYFHKKYNSGFRLFTALLSIITRNKLRAFKYQMMNSEPKFRFLFIKSYFYAVIHFLRGKQGRFTKVEVE